MKRFIIFILTLVLSTTVYSQRHTFYVDSYIEIYDGEAIRDTNTHQVFDINKRRIKHSEYMNKTRFKCLSYFKVIEGSILTEYYKIELRKSETYAFIIVISDTSDISEMKFLIIDMDKTKFAMRGVYL